MNALAPITAQTLPLMIDRAAQALSSARTSAEVLEARDMAGIVYDVAKKAARLAKAKGAHDELIAAAHRSQADALEIEAAAKRRLADEYDAAQERHEVQRRGGHGTSKAEVPKATDVGVTHKDMHEARIIRDAELADPGIVKRTVDAAVAAGDEPTKAKVRRAVIEAARPDKPAPRSGREDICHRVRDALVALTGLPPAAEVAGFFRGTDSAIVLVDRLPVVRDWVNQFVTAWESGKC